MAYLSNALTSEHLSTDGVQGLHYKLISKVSLSNAIKLLTPAKLRSLPLLPNTTLPNNYDRTPGKFVFANPARTYPIVYNNKEGMLVSKLENSDRI
ncbi:hypothetical protein J4E91_011288 [Alternaria rosae]|nr:hypothetical protein J4E91_011288 [Alternaria rosae]